MRGFTLIEIVIVIAILAVISFFSVNAYSKYNFAQALEKSSAQVTSLLSQARTLTLSSKGNLQYGVHFDNNQIILFRSAVYSSGSSTNLIYPLNNSVVLSTNLTGGGSNVVFEKITGKTSQSGTITLTSTVNSSSTKSITIYSTGTIQSN